MVETIAPVLMLTWWPICHIERACCHVYDDGRDALALLDEGPFGIVVQANAVRRCGVIGEHGA